MRNQRDKPKKNSTIKERQKRRKEDFKRGYLNGYEDALKSIKGSLFASKRGYGKGYKDSQTVIKINKKYNKFKNQK